VDRIGATIVALVAIAAPPGHLVSAHAGQRADGSKERSVTAAAPAAVPAELAAAVAGVWDLGPSYRITLHRSGDGLTVRQDAAVRLKGRVKRDGPVEYDRAAGLLRFQGIGAVHPTVVTLRWQNGELEYAFTTETSPGKRLQGAWEKAARRPAPAN
jgi:hypothetical protein